MILKRDGKHDVLVKETVAAIVRRADLNADLAIALVRILRPDGLMPNLPRAAWLELGALAQIYVWERQGVLSLLATQLPRFSEAMADLADRFETAARDQNAPLEPLLSTLVFEAWLDEFALDGLDHESADIVVRSNIDDGILDALASFVWSHRAELESLINGETTP